MHINAARLVYFSPTQTTRRVLEGIARGLQVGKVKHLDLTPPEARTQDFDPFYDELAVIGAPVYAGRIPVDAVRRLRRLKGHDTSAVLIVVYGNREYEDALLELKDLAAELGFIPLAGGAFIGEHSFSNSNTPIAEGRPDQEDLEKTIAFGETIQRRLQELSTVDEVPSLQVPGNYPYKERGKSSMASPVTREELCEKCETCAVVCPTGAVTVKDIVITDQEACILCCACVKSCPTGARVMEHARVLQSAQWLYDNYSARKEPEMYI